MAQNHKSDPDNFSSRNSLGCPKKCDTTFKFCTFSHFKKSSKNSVKGLTIYVYDCLKMGCNLGFSMFEISANVRILKTNFKAIAVYFYPTLIITFYLPNQITKQRKVYFLLRLHESFDYMILD